MTRFIAQWIDNGIMILTGLLLLRFYFKPEAKRLYKKKWVLFICVFLILYNVIKIGLAYNEHLKNRVPSRAEVERAILANNTVADADFVYRSPHGYSILIPTGYAYTNFESGPLSLTAVKDESAIVIGKQSDSNPVDKTARDICQYLKQKNPTYLFSAQESIRIGKSPAIRLTIQVTKENVPIKGFLVFLKNGDQLFQVMCSCPAAVFEENRDQFEGIIASLALN